MFKQNQFDYHSINGHIVSTADAQLNAADIGFRRGYTAFDYFRVVAGQPMFIEDHLERFENSAKLMRLPMPKLDLHKHVSELIARNNVQEAGVQLFLTGGIAQDGFSISDPELVILVTPLPKSSAHDIENGIKLISHKYQRDFPEIKSTNYMMAVYLSKTIKDAGATDALYHDGTRVLETTRSNIFIVKDGIVASSGTDVLLGITRKQLLKLIPKLAKLELRDVSLSELWNADEVFICSTTKGALAVTQIDEQKIAAGKVGALTQKIAQAYKDHAEAYLGALAV